MSESKAHNRPIISLAFGPRMSRDREKLQRALTVLVQEYPSIRSQTESIDGQIILSGMNDSHLEEICDRVLYEYKILLDIGEFQVIYLETIRTNAEGEGKYIRQTGGLGNYAHCKIRLVPQETGEGHQFVNEINSGVIPEEFIESIEQGIREALDGGVLFGYPVVDVAITLYGGSYHDTDSNKIAFKIAGSMALKEAARKANPILLEPVMAVEVRVPDEYLRTIIGSINARRGRIEFVEHGAGSPVIRASVPLAEMIDYGKYLRSGTQGRAHHSMQFSRYEAAPRRDNLGGNAAGVTVNRPRGPKAGKGFAAADLETEPE